MAVLTLKADPGETVKLFHAAKVEPWLRHGEVVPLAPVDTQVGAVGTGLVSFTVGSRIEFYAQRANRQFIKLLSSTTRVTTHIP